MPVRGRPPAPGNVLLAHNNGKITPFSGVNTNLRRGELLREAVSAAVPQDIIYVSPGSFDLGDQNLILPDYVNLDMSSNTLITSTRINEPIVMPGNNSVISGGAIQGVAPEDPFQFPIGVMGVGIAKTGIQVIGVRLIADSDGFYFGSTAPCSAILRDCILETKFDGAVAILAAHTVDLYNCRIVVTGPTATTSPGTARGVFASGATVRMFGGNISVSNGGADVNAGAYTQGAGVIELNDVPIATSNGADPKADLWNTGGTIRVTGGRGSGTNGLYTTSGTITYLKGAP